MTDSPKKAAQTAAQAVKPLPNSMKCGILNGTSGEQWHLPLCLAQTVASALTRVVTSQVARLEATADITDRSAHIGTSGNSGISSGNSGEQWHVPRPARESAARCHCHKLSMLSQEIGADYFPHISHSEIIPWGRLDSLALTSLR